MNKNLTDITVVLDRSGSMGDCWDDTLGGLNNFIEDQKTGPGLARFTLRTFDTVHETPIKSLDIRDVPKITKRHADPRGGTALLDAIGKAIYEKGKELSELQEKDRPFKVVMVIQTDGYENQSREFTAKLIKEMVEHQTNKYSWNFVYLGADIDAFANNESFGFSNQHTASYGKMNTGDSFDSLSQNIKSYRGTNQQTAHNLAAGIGK